MPAQKGQSSRWVASWFSSPRGIAPGFPPSAPLKSSGLLARSGEITTHSLVTRFSLSSGMVGIYHSGGGSIKRSLRAREAFWQEKPSTRVAIMWEAICPPRFQPAWKVNVRHFSAKCPPEVRLKSGRLTGLICLSLGLSARALEVIFKVCKYIPQRPLELRKVVYNLMAHLIKLGHVPRHLLHLLRAGIIFTARH